jgi:hypothetical protein
MRKSRKRQYYKAVMLYEKHLRFLDRIGAYCTEDYWKHIVSLKLRGIRWEKRADK